MSNMLTFSLWLANEIFVNKSNEAVAWDRAKKKYCFNDGDKAWFIEQYKVVEIEALEPGIELRDGDPVHLEPTQEELDQEKWIEEHQEEITDEWMEYYRKN